MGPSIRPSNETPKRSARPKSARRRPISSKSEEANVASTLPPRATYSRMARHCASESAAASARIRSLNASSRSGVRKASCTSSNGTRASISA